MNTHALTGTTTQTTQRGIGLIEALVTLVIIAAGLLAISVLMSRVTSESTINKARSEAALLCEREFNRFRTSLTQNDFDEAISIAFPSLFEDPPQPINDEYFEDGVTDRYIVSITGDWASLAGVQLNMTCRPENLSTASGADGVVQLSSLIEVHQSVGSVLASEGEKEGRSAISPSLNANSSDDVSVRISTEVLAGLTDAPDDSAGSFEAGDIVTTNQTVGGTETEVIYVVDDTGTTASQSAVCADIFPTPTFLGDGSGLKARRGLGNPSVASVEQVDGSEDSLLYDPLRYEQIELFEVTDSYCTPRVRFNAGVIVPIRGTVHSRISNGGSGYLPVDLFTFDVSESGTYCTFDPSPIATSAPYYCYVGGNCENNTTGGDDADYDYFQCPRWGGTASVAALSIAEEVGIGGWRGQVGLINLADVNGDGSTSDSYNACFGEEINQAYADSGSLAYKASSRNYYTTNYFVSGDGNGYYRNEGLNQPQICQDFVIIDPPTGNPAWSALQSACDPDIIGFVAGGSTGLTVESKEYERELALSASTVANVFNPVPNNFCGSTTALYTISGTFVYSPIDPPVTFLESDPAPFIEITDASGEKRNCEITGSRSYECTADLAPGTATVTGIQGDTYNCSATISQGVYDLTGCTLTFTALPSDGFSNFTVSGDITGDSTATDIYPTGGVRSITMSYTNDSGNIQTYDCSVNDDYSGTGRTYTCLAWLPGDASVNIDIEVDSDYSLDALSSVTSAQTTHTAGQDAPNFTIYGSGATTYIIEGDLIVDSDVLDSSDPDTTPFITHGGARSCSLTETALGTYTYSCEISSSAAEVSISFGINEPICTVGNGNSSGKAYVVTVGGSYSAPYSVETYTVPNAVLAANNSITGPTVTVEESNHNCSGE